MEQKAYWIAFNKVLGIGPARLASLIESCGSVEAAWKAPLRQLMTTNLDRRTLENLLNARQTVDPGEEWRRVHASQIDVLTWADPDYPANLRQIDGSPPLLYVDGQIDDRDRWAVAVVGTRRASAYGREVAHSLATQLVQRGVTVVSGLALGIDTVAHKAALAAGGRTIAVLGSGVDQVYPAQNRSLARSIAEQGAVISEYALGTRPEARYFPPRNRIISGLSRGVVIVEAGKRSGALITADFAAEQGRDVFAVPGSILHPGSVGCNTLIQNGAAPLLSVDDVLEQLDLTKIQEQHSVRAVVPSDPLESQLLHHLSGEPRHVDDLVRCAAMPSAQISSLLTVMELKGLVRQTDTLCYVRA